MLLATAAATGEAAEVPTARPEHWSLKGAAESAYRKKDFQGCAAKYLEAAQANAWAAGISLYGAACCEALAGHAEAAFQRLESALAAGYQNAEWLAGDTDFVSLRADPRWPDLLERVKAREAAFRKTLHLELTRLVEEDQAERRNVRREDWAARWPEIKAHDEARRKRAAEILGAESQLVAADYFSAALIFQHGEAVEEIERAEQLALKALALDPRHGPARWLVAASRDRLRMYRKQPQLYGTQFVLAPTGGVVRYQTDPAINDQQRAEWNVPPLGESDGVPK